MPGPTDDRATAREPGAPGGDASPGPPKRVVLPAIGLLLAYFGIAVAFQAANGAFQAELWGADEAAHYVTGLLALDYATAPAGPPLAFARSFYEHYPKVAIGHWPPGFYVVQAAWMAAFSESRSSILLLIAALAAAAALLSQRLWRCELGRAGAAVLGAVFLILPLSQTLTGAVMAEMPLVCWFLLASLAYADYLRTGKTAQSLLFGAFATAAILTKANGLALALLPPIALLLSRKLGWVRRPSFWAPAALVAPLCAPWYLATFEVAQEGWSAKASPKFLLGEVAVFNVRALAEMMGPLLFGLALIGLWLAALRPAAKSGSRPVLAVAGALLLSVFLFHTFVAPVRAQRHLLAASPALLGFAALALLAAARRIAPQRQRAAGWLLAGVALAAFGLTSFKLAPKPPYGARALVDYILRHAAGSDRIFVSAPLAEGEGVIVAEIAMQDQRPGLTIIRASKTLAASDWAGKGYRLRLGDTDQVTRFLQEESIDFVIVERPRDGVNPKHHRLLLDALRCRPQHFRKIPVESERGALAVMDLYAVAPDSW